MNLTRTLKGTVDITGLTKLEDRQAALKDEFRRILPPGWRIDQSQFNHSPDMAEIRYKVVIEPIPLKIMENGSAVPLL